MTDTETSRDHSQAETQLEDVAASGGQLGTDAHCLRAPADLAGHSCIDDHGKHAGQDQGAQPIYEAQAALAALVLSIRETWRQRQDHHRAEKSLTLQIKAICRRACEGDKKEAAALYASICNGAGHALAEPVLMATARFFDARNGLEQHRKALEKQLATLAKDLPIHDWWVAQRGCAAGGLAALVAECAGDNFQAFGDFATVSKLWRRLGLAVMGDGKRQRRVAGDAALLHGYSPQRRSVMWNVGQSIFKAQSAKVDKETGEVEREAGPFRTTYDARKSFERSRDPEMSAGHAHNRACRYMEKAVVKAIWIEWRRTLKEQAAARKC